MLWFKYSLHILQHLSELSENPFCITCIELAVWNAAFFSVSDCNWTRTHDHLTRKRTFYPVWLNDWVFVYELSGCGFESSCSYLNFKFRACFKQGVPWHSCDFRVWIHFETRTCHNKNIKPVSFSVLSFF